MSRKPCACGFFYFRMFRKIASSTAFREAKRAGKGFACLPEPIRSLFPFINFCFGTGRDDEVVRNLLPGVQGRFRVPDFLMPWMAKGFPLPAREENREPLMNVSADNHQLPSPFSPEAILAGVMGKILTAFVMVLSMKGINKKPRFMLAIERGFIRIRIKPKPHLPKNVPLSIVRTSHTISPPVAA